MSTQRTAPGTSEPSSISLHCTKTLCTQPLTKASVVVPSPSCAQAAGLRVGAPAADMPPDPVPTRPDCPHGPTPLDDVPPRASGASTGDPPSVGLLGPHAMKNPISTA